MSKRMNSKIKLLPKNAKIVLLRHGESEGNAQKIMQGSGEYPLSEKGKVQVLEARETVSSWLPSNYLASTLSRSIDTALILSGLNIVKSDERFNERGAGKWEGLARSHMEALYPGSLEDDTVKPDDFEPESEVIDRMLKGLWEVRSYSGLSIIVGHGATLRLLDRKLNGGGNRFKYLEGLIFDEELNILSRIKTLEEE